MKGVKSVHIAMDPVLRIRIRDPVLFDLSIREGKKFRIRDEPLNIPGNIPRAWNFWVKNIKIILCGSGSGISLGLDLG